MSNFKLALLFLISLSLAIIGCSQRGNDPVQPDINVNSQPDHVLLGSWTANLNLQDMTVDTGEFRSNSAHYDARYFLPYPDIVINSYDPLTGIVDLGFTIENSFPVDAYDVRLIIYTDDAGHMLKNPDDWTGLYDIPGGFVINPFKAFFDPAQAGRVFPAETSLTENIQIYIPSGNTNVKFAIDASFPSNCDEPYEINNFIHDIIYDYQGSSTAISIDVFDWQEDVNSVELYCPWFTGGTNIHLTHSSGNTWEGALVNEVPAGSGDHPVIFIAKSENSGDLALYDWFTITVNHLNMIFVDDDNTSGPWDGTMEHPYQYVQDAVDNAIDNTTIWIKPGTYNEDPGGTGGEAEITIEGISDLTIYGEGMPDIVLHSPSGPFRSGLYANNCPGIKVEGLKFTPSYLYGAAIKLDSCPDATVRNCTVAPYPVIGFMEFFRARYCDNLVLENNDISGMHSSATGSYLISVWDSNNARVSENICLNHIHTGGNVYNTTVVFLNIRDCNNLEISKNVLGKYNRVYPSENWVRLELITAKDGDGLVIRNNLLYDLYFENEYDTDPVSNNYGITCTNISNLEIYNNTLDGLGSHHDGFGETVALGLSFCTDAMVYNNIFSNLNAPTSGEIVGFKSDQACIVDYSDLWNLVGGTIIPFGDLATMGTGTIETDPMFNDPANGDYTLMPGSPCEDTGLDGYDMGCYGGVDPLT